MFNAIIINPRDTVATVTTPIKKGEVIYYVSCKKAVTAGANIPVYHKVAIQKAKKGEKIYKYGEIIGYATEDIERGDHVHTHNLGSEKTD